MVIMENPAQMDEKWGPHPMTQETTDGGFVGKSPAPMT